MNITKTFQVMTGAVLVAWVGVAGAALPVRQDAGTITLGRQTPAQAADLARGDMKPGSTIHVPAGYELPIDIAMRGDLAATIEPVTPVRLKARRNLWVRFTGDAVVLSLDGVNFRPIQEVVTGSVSFALKANDDGSNLRGELATEIRVKHGDR